MRFCYIRKYDVGGTMDTDQQTAGDGGFKAAARLGAPIQSLQILERLHKA